MTSPVAQPQEVLVGLLHALAMACCLFVLAAQALATPQGQQNAATNYVIERINLYGLRRVETGTIRALISSGPGRPYNPEQVQRDAQTLRDTGFFDEVRPEVEDSPDRPNEKMVIFRLVERPIIRRIEYKGIRSLTERDVLQALNENKVRLAVESYFDQAQLSRAAAVIKDLLARMDTHQRA
jgi:outer membrane protein insertion porin family